MYSANDQCRRRPSENVIRVDLKTPKNQVRSEFAQDVRFTGERTVTFTDDMTAT